jgi:signal transduction histidine kinase
VQGNLDSAETNITARPMSATQRLARTLRSPLASTISRVHGYVPALAAFATAIAVHWIALHVFGTVSFAVVMFLYVTAIVVGGWCGYGPGILTVLLVFLVPAYLFGRSHSIHNMSASALGGALLLSLMISRGASSRRRSEAALIDTNEVLEERVREKTAELAEANAALQRHNAELIRVNADLEQFAYSASHDLQEPLRMVSLFTQMLRAKYADSLDAEGQEYIGHAVAGAKRLETLIRDLRSYLAISSTGAAPELVDANTVVARCLKNLQLLIEQRGVRCEVGSLPAVRLHEVHLEQLFQNLITNGIKYRRLDAPHIRISASRDDGNWICSVQDNGIGIDPRYQDQIFGVFRRLHSNDEYEGTGIGLAICKRIIERYGGRIWVESKPGEGSTFRFSVPA